MNTHQNQPVINPQLVKTLILYYNNIMNLSLTKSFVILLFSIVLILPTNHTLAVELLNPKDEAEMDFYDDNNILFYDKDGNLNSEYLFIIGEENLPDETIKQLESEPYKSRLQSNLKIYQSLASEYNIPWQAVAALHYREGDMDPKKSILDGSDLNSEDDLIKSGKLALNKLKSSAKSVYDINISNINNIENWSKSFIAFKYGDSYKKQNLPYYESSYAINGIDKNNYQMYIKNPNDQELSMLKDSQLGATTIMKYNQANISPSKISIQNSSGLNKQQAIRFMQRYSENRGGESRAQMSDLWFESINHTGGSNCVTFSGFFLNKFTGSKYNKGHGYQLIYNLNQNTGKITDIPRPFSVFSYGNGNGYANHTGIILGISGNSYIIGEAGWFNRHKKSNSAGDGTYNGSGSGYITIKTGNPKTWYNGSGNIRFFEPNHIDINGINNYISKY